MNMEQWGNDIFAGENEVLGENLPSATLSTTNPTWIKPGANPGLRGERPATNRLSPCSPLHSNYNGQLWSAQNCRYYSLAWRSLLIQSNWRYRGPKITLNIALLEVSTYQLNGPLWRAQNCPNWALHGGLYLAIVMDSYRGPKLTLQYSCLEGCT
jgi:hypothetical protein